MSGVCWIPSTVFVALDEGRHAARNGVRSDNEQAEVEAGHEQVPGQRQRLGDARQLEPAHPVRPRRGTEPGVVDLDLRCVRGHADSASVRNVHGAGRTPGCRDEAAHRHDESGHQHCSTEAAKPHERPPEFVRGSGLNSVVCAAPADLSVRLCASPAETLSLPCRCAISGRPTGQTPSYQSVTPAAILPAHVKVMT